MAKKWITKTYSRDAQALTAIARCGHVRREHLTECKIADKRLKNYERDNLVEKASYYNSKSNAFETGYKLTKAGRQFVEKEFGYRRNDMQVAQSVNHDLGIADKYFSISETERASWQTENQLRDRFEQILNELENTDINRHQEIKEMKTSTPDGAYTTIDGVEIVYEVVTNSYGKDEIQAKENHIKITGGTMEYGYR